MNHSFLCIVGCDVYPTFCYLSYRVDCDFDRFVRQPQSAGFDGLTYSEDTEQDMEENKSR